MAVRDPLECLDKAARLVFGIRFIRQKHDDIFLHMRYWTSIRRVPILTEGESASMKEDLLQMIQSKSVFCGGKGEGFYVKIEEDGFVKRRVKVILSPATSIGRKVAFEKPG